MVRVADSWVAVENGTDAYYDPGKKIHVEAYPFRTTCCKYDDGWYAREENLKIDPPTEKLNKGIDDVLFVEVFISIFSKDPIP